METIKILIVDDEEIRHEMFRKKYPMFDITSVYNSSDAIKLLSKNKYNTIFLDHDLGGDDTGVKVAEFIDRAHIRSFIIVHSMNPVGASNIKRILPSARILPGAFAEILP